MSLGAWWRTISANKCPQKATRPLLTPVASSEGNVMSEKSKLASDIQPFKPRWRLNWPFWWVGGGCSRAALSHAPVLAKSAPLAVSVRPHTPNCRASGRQQHNTPTRRPTCQPVRPSHEGEPGATCAAGGPDRACAAGGPDRTTTTSSGLRRQRTPCSSDLAVVQRRRSQGVARKLPSIRNLQVGHPETRGTSAAEPRLQHMCWCMPTSHVT